MTGSATQLIPDTLRLRVGGLDPACLRAALTARGVLLNAHAETLLDHPAFSARLPEEIIVVQKSVEALGFAAGATLPRVFAVARRRGLGLCPPDAGPYLRLALLHQPDAPDSVLSAGRSPSGSLKVASAPLRDDESYPKGFYLRAVDGQLWLRGYRCGDEYCFPPDQDFIFRVDEGPAPVAE
ncbi:hypothetical protein [Arthrobacter sp.]|uniref:hypothetical protein n=1 Tax=Arthrobacter sp. TaxID=1667 RepID=UPI00258A396D|nr:hypothetical protein [Arthrobacter sp.]